MHFAEYDSPMGRILLRSSGGALTGLWFSAEERPLSEDPLLGKVKLWLEDYFRGADRPPDFPVELEGTPFQKQVWQQLQTIPYGSVRTYGQIARSLSPTMSAQAVGQAVGRNPVAIVIPCHRVVGTGGRLTGYAWDIQRKQWLLNHERS